MHPQHDTHLTDLFADSAIRFIRKNRDRPFFCYLPFNAVHGPLRNRGRARDSAKPEWLKKYAQQGVPQPRRDYCAVMSHADARVGDILSTLHELNLDTRHRVLLKKWYRSWGQVIRVAWNIRYGWKCLGFRGFRRQGLATRKSPLSGPKSLKRLVAGARNHLNLLLFMKGLPKPARGT